MHVVELGKINFTNTSTTVTVMQDPNSSVKLSMNMTVYEESHNIHKITFFCIKLEVNNGKNSQILEIVFIDS